MNLLIMVLVSYSFVSFSFWGSYSSKKIEPWTKNTDIDAYKLSEDQREDYTDQIKELKSANYRPSTSYTDRVIKNYIKNPKNCSKSGKIKVIQNGRERSRRIFTYDESFMKAITESPTVSIECLKKLTQNYIKYKKKEENPLDSTYCKKRKSDCDLVKEYQNRFEQNVITLQNLLLPKSVDQADCYGRTSQKDATLEGLLREVKQSQEINKCVPLEKGEVRTVNSRIGIVPQKYSVKKNSDKEYELLLNVNFQFKETKESTTDNLSLDEKAGFNKKVSECLGKNNPNIKDPAGRSLKINLLGKEDLQLISEDLRPPKVNINVIKDYDRDNVGNYSLGIDCSTIIHELLHLTGLADEYEEMVHGKYVHQETGEVIDTDKGNDAPTENRSDYDFESIYAGCRVVPENNSIMGSSSKFYRDFYDDGKTHCKCGAWDRSKSLSSSFRPSPEEIIEQQDNKINFCEDRLSNLNQDQIAFFARSSQTLKLSPDNVSKEFLDSCSVINSKTKFTNLKSPSFEIPKYFENIEKKNKKIFYKVNFIDVLNLGSDHGKRITYTVSCDCQKGNEADCDNYIHELESINSGDSSKETQSCPDDMFYKDLKLDDLKTGNKLFSFDRSTKKINKNKPFLRTAHFERIISADCLYNTKRYLECIKFAYETDKNKCRSEKPKYCDDESLWLDSVK